MPKILNIDEIKALNSSGDIISFKKSDRLTVLLVKEIQKLRNRIQILEDRYANA